MTVVRPKTTRFKSFPVIGVNVYHVQTRKLIECQENPFSVKNPTDVDWSPLYAYTSTRISSPGMPMPGATWPSFWSDGPENTGVPLLVASIFGFKTITTILSWAWQWKSFAGYGHEGMRPFFFVSTNK